MTRTTEDAKITTRADRDRLPPRHEPYWRSIDAASPAAPYHPPRSGRLSPQTRPAPDAPAGRCDGNQAAPKRQHLGNRPRIYSKTAGRLATADPLNPDRVTDLTIQSHELHHPALCDQRKELH